MRSFRYQVDELVGAGFRVAVPAMRGYLPSGVPKSGRYDAEMLGRDLLAVADELSPEQPVHLVGHDWGAVAAYAASVLAPTRLISLATMAVPHLRVALPRWRRARQLRRSWYMMMFQLPVIAERRLRADDFALIERLWRDWSPGYDAPREEMQHVKDAIAPRVPEVLACYRALLRGAAPKAARLLQRRVSVPSLYLHGADDGCVGSELATELEPAYEAGVQVHIVQGAGHFLHIERPAEINALLLQHLRQAR
jgi:pimeloyl-ACP methyl ester carboxylesterase